MQWMAWSIWGALALCFLLGIGLVLYSRRKQGQEQARKGVAERPEVSISPAAERAEPDARRWQELVSRFDLSIEEWPAPADRCSWAHQVLGIQPDWLRGAPVTLFPFLTFHNRVEESFDFLRQLRQQYDQRRLIVVRPAGVPLREDYYHACAILCFAARTGDNNSHPPRWRYFPVNVLWDWGYAPEQLQCCQLLAIARQAGCQLEGSEATPDELDLLLEGQGLPAALLQGGSLWNAEPLASTVSGSFGGGVRLMTQEEIETRLRQEGWD